MTDRSSVLTCGVAVHVLALLVTGVFGQAVAGALHVADVHQYCAGDGSYWQFLRAMCCFVGSNMLGW